MKSASHSNKLTPFRDLLAEKTRSQAAGFLSKKTDRKCQGNTSQFQTLPQPLPGAANTHLDSVLSQQTNAAPGSEQDPSGSCSTPKPGLSPRSTDRTHPHNICCGMVRHRDPAGTVGTSTVSLTSGCSFFVLPLLQFHLQFHTRPFQYFQLHF